MRTVDPVEWSRSVVKPPLDVGTTFERRLRRSLSDAVGEFLRNCSMPGVRFAADKGSPRVIRWWYAALLAGAAVGWALVTTRDFSTFSSRPLLMLSLQAPLRPHQLDFPAVALCSYNTISAAELDIYAKELYSQENKSYSLEGLKSNLQAFSGLITSASHVKFDANFTKYLAEVAGETNVTNIIYRLSPKCKSMLSRCEWRGARSRCDQLFAMRLTDVGYCCVFNARYSSEDRRNPPHRVSTIGTDNGLSVVIKENTDDFTEVRRSGEELEMLIFNGVQYPLMRAGVLRTYPLRRNASVFVALRGTEWRASPALRYYTEAWRGCALSHPQAWSRQLWSQCVAECRRTAALALCLCRPHTQPATGNGSIDELTCTLEHLACLDKYQEKLTNFYPGEEGHESLSEEQANSVECLHCRANCGRLRHAAHVWTVPYAHHYVEKIFYNHFVDGVTLWNSTVLRIYFTSDEQDLYLVEPYMRPYGIIVYVSSQWVVLVGPLVVCLAEGLYHCCVRWRHHYTRRQRDHQFTTF